MVEKLYISLAENNADLSICNFLYEYENPAYTDSEKNTNLPIHSELTSGEEVLKKKQFQDKSWYWVTAWNKLYKRDLFNDLRFENGLLHEDEFIFHKIMLQCTHIACISEALYHYVQRVNSIMHSSPTMNTLMSAIAFFDRADALVAIDGYSDAAAADLCRGVGVICRYYYQIGFCFDNEHRVTNKKLQKQYNKTYKIIRNTRYNIAFTKRLFMILCRLSILGTARIYAVYSNAIKRKTYDT